MGGLRYVEHGGTGITRRALKQGFAFFAPDGTRITDADEIARLNAVGLPPAYTDAWYCPHPDGHLQATGIDARGRRQYRYHPEFRSTREAAKFDACPAFGARLPDIRAAVAADLKRRGLVRERAIASVVRLLDTGGIRVGNEAYARSNKSYGATTLRMRHVKVEGQEKLRLRFKAKSGQQRDMKVTDRALARFVRAMQDLPGQQLFQFLGDDGPHPVTSGDVNDYIRAHMGNDFTAKHFRTWTASRLAFERVLADPALPLKQLLLDVSAALGNTPAIARASYIHPRIIDAVQGKAELPTGHLPRATRWLSRSERGLIAWLG